MLGIICGIYQNAAHCIQEDLLLQEVLALQHGI